MIRDAAILLGLLAIGALLGVATGWVFGLTVGTIVLALGVLALLRSAVALRR